MGLVAKFRAWLLDIVREAVRLEFHAVTATTFVSEIPKPKVVSEPAVPVILDTFEAERDAAIKSCEVDNG